MWLIFCKLLEARGGIEPPNKGFAGLYLTTFLPNPLFDFANLPARFAQILCKSVMSSAPRRRSAKAASDFVPRCQAEKWLRAFPAVEWQRTRTFRASIDPAGWERRFSLRTRSL